MVDLFGEVVANFKNFKQDRVNKNNERKLKMSDRKKFVDELKDFFNSNDSVALITGMDDKEKLIRTLNELNRMYKKGTIYTNILKYLPDQLNDKFGHENKVFPREITKSTKTKFGNMTLKFNKYSENGSSSLVQKEDDFALYFPIQSVLKEDKATENLIEHINLNEAPKKILITTNDLKLDICKLKPVVDTYIHYEVKNDNKEIYENSKKTLKSTPPGCEINPVYKNLID